MYIALALLILKLVSCLLLLLTRYWQANEATPLHISTGKSDNHNPISVWLLKAEAGPNARNNRGNTPLHVAALTGDSALHVGELLLRAKVDPNAEDDVGATPLYRAAETNGNSSAVVHMLLECGANPNKTDMNGTTPFEKAKARGHKNVMNVIKLMR